MNYKHENDIIQSLLKKLEEYKIFYDSEVSNFGENTDLIMLSVNFKKKYATYCFFLFKQNDSILYKYFIKEIIDKNIETYIGSNIRNFYIDLLTIYTEKKDLKSLKLEKKISEYKSDIWKKTNLIDHNIKNVNELNKNLDELLLKFKELKKGDKN